MHAYVLTSFVLVCVGVFCNAFTAIGAASPTKRSVALVQLAVGVSFAVWGAKLLWF